MLTVLRTPTEWHDWSVQFKSKIRDLDLQWVILEGQPPLPASTRPDPNAYANGGKGRRPQQETRVSPPVVGLRIEEFVEDDIGPNPYTPFDPDCLRGLTDGEVRKFNIGLSKI
ncbi:uncharacterized protein DNG_04297 [Cephalotrichum gorgonifer]|uniref:Uncharacterized protein n=1 Tax=Cephalotrichum gorgonifer TaxID=2041049 RepID=A0AAE8MXQ5_9PEZI|nr:uncharacterized protein DNG_04297 [Cephalotrichum gorgonifer]